MYAIFKSGGKQYRASKGDKLKLEKINNLSSEKVVFNEVLSVGDGADINCGTPYIKDATVEAKVLEEGKDKKIEVIKKSRLSKTKFANTSTISKHNTQYTITKRFNTIPARCTAV